MALALLSHEASDLTLGKPALPWLPSTATVRDAIVYLKLHPDAGAISVWECDHSQQQLQLQLPDAAFRLDSDRCCRCVGKVSMLSVVCFLASDQSLRDPAKALQSPLSSLLPGDKSEAIQHLDPRGSLQEVLSLIVAGAENIVIPINGPANKRTRNRILKNSISHKHFFAHSSKSNPKTHNGREYCWLAHEDVLRFLLGSVGVFSPLPMMSIKDLGIIQTDVISVGVEDDAASIISILKRAGGVVAVVDKSDDGQELLKLVGEISCSVLQTCNESAALALAVLSVGEFLAYIQDCRNPPQALQAAIQSGLEEKLRSYTNNDLHEPNSIAMEIRQMLDNFDIWEDSSDEDAAQHDPIHKWHSENIHSHIKIGCAMKSHNAPICCRPTSSLIAVIMQALAHREQYVWVTNEDDALVGIVTFADIFTVLSNHLKLSC